MGLSIAGVLCVSLDDPEINAAVDMSRDYVIVFKHFFILKKLKNKERDFFTFVIRQEENYTTLL